MLAGEMIRCYRLIHQVEATEFARSLGISARVLQRLEAGQPVEQQALLSVLAVLFAPEPPQGPDPSKPVKDTAAAETSPPPAKAAAKPPATAPSSRDTRRAVARVS